LFQPQRASDELFANQLADLKADLFVVVAFGEIIKQHLLDMPPLGCINLHASLLPKYRGAAPIQRCIINGEKESGVTIMQMVRKMDAGDMIEVVKTPIDPNMTFGELEKKLCHMGSKALLKVIRDLERGQISKKPQDEAEVTFAQKIELEDCQIDWSLPASRVHNLVRGVNPYPGAWTFVNVRQEVKRMKIFSTRVTEHLGGNPGQILGLSKEGLTVACGEQALQLLEVQLEGKKVMNPEELFRGIPLEKFSIHLKV
jgi:methionyl-tRNA formyltransferase